LTTEGGLDCVKFQKRLATITKRLHKKGILVSTFILPDEKQIAATAEAGCDAIELHTGLYANATKDKMIEKRLNELRDGRDIAAAAGLIVHAGHGLTYRNIGPVAAIEGLCEFNIGHSIISRAVLTGIGPAVEEMKMLVETPL
ncbi:MAG: pyridoxine 5'-phosphate synthase, partial [Planctomycetota bacterium]